MFSFLLFFLHSTASLANEIGLVNKETLATSASTQNQDYQKYIDFFEEVYDVMQENYYKDVTRESFQKFITVFNNKIYNQLKKSGKSINFVRWRSAAYLVEYLKESNDSFSAFFPPKAAKDYEEEVLGKRIDLGIEGELTAEGFVISRVEPRADAYEKGLREKDVILNINDVSVLTLSQKQIDEILNPLENTSVQLNYLSFLKKTQNIIDVISKEYFKQFVFLIPVDVPNVYCIQIQRFNRMTAEDLTQFMTFVIQQSESSLIIDLRGNPGGPPLAARAISAFFLPPEQEFAFFQKKNKPKALLKVPKIPKQFHYKGDIVILVDEKSGSAAELFSGILQEQKRAIIIGKNTAGRVFLKSMFHFDDDSMVLLVTARGHFPNGDVFSYNGVQPDEFVEGKEKDLILYAAEYLVEKQKYKQN